MGQHFNLPNHSISDMILQGIEALANRRESVRLSREKMWDQACPHHSPPWSQHSGREWLISPFFFSSFFLSPQKLFTFILHLFLHLFYILFCLLVYLSVLFYTHFLTHCFFIILSSSINSWYLYSLLISFVWSQGLLLTLLFLSSSFVFISHLTNFLS